MTPCILFQGHIKPNGYGQKWVGGKPWQAHRWAAHVAHGPCPPGQVVRHECDNKACVNPDHLEYGTQGDNLTDCRDRSEVYRKIGREDADNIKKMIAEGAGPKAVMARYPIGRTMYYNIKNGSMWETKL